MLNTLNNIRKKKVQKKRLGRGIGSGVGKTSGRGHKGQKSRSGVSLKGFEGGQMPLYRRLPKRGFKNIFKKKFSLINLIKIQSLIDKKIIDSKENISKDLLLKKKLIKKRTDGLKILGNGDIKTKIFIEADKASKNAIKKIEKVGGKINIINIKEKKINTKELKKDISENKTN